MIEKGRLLAATVASTALEAMSNWLAERHPGMPPGVPEHYVRRQFSQIAGLRGAELAPVTIFAQRRAPPSRRQEAQPDAEEGEY